MVPRREIHQDDIALVHALAKVDGMSILP
jgi:hypothetical protein